MTRAPVVPSPCHCSHDVSDHCDWDGPCDIYSCRCDSFEADGQGSDDERAEP